jgi:hypothetical protein
LSGFFTNISILYWSLNIRYKTSHTHKI